VRLVGDLETRSRLFEAERTFARNSQVFGYEVSNTLAHTSLDTRCTNHMDHDLVLNGDHADEDQPHGSTDEADDTEADGTGDSPEPIINGDDEPLVVTEELDPPASEHDLEVY
jgi:hypothetical protein